MKPKQFVDILCPEHDRNSCDDKNTANGFGSRMGTATYEKCIDGETYKREIKVPVYRCRRCALLEIALEDYMPENRDYFSGDELIVAMIRFNEQFSEKLAT